MRLDELLALDEHAARAAARVVDPALIGCQHLDQHAHDMGRRIELAALLALGAGELRQEIFVDTAKDVAGAIGRAAEPDIADEVDKLAEALLVEARAGVVLWQDGFERGVVAFDRRHRIIHALPDRRLRCRALQIGPARFRRHPEDVFRAILVRVFRIGAFSALRVELGVFRLERVGDVFEENEAEHDVLVLGGIHVVAQRVGRLPQLRLEAERRPIVPPPRVGVTA